MSHEDDESGSPPSLDRRRFLKLSAGVVVGLTGCQSADGLPRADGGPGTDAATPIDAGRSIDDAGSPVDASMSVDAPPADASDPGDAALSGPEALPEAPLEVFPIGVSSGDALPDGVVLQTLYTGADPLEVMTWPAGGDAVASVVATVADGGFVHVAIDGLEPGSWYHYTFHETAGAGRRSGIGRFRTALADDALEPLVIGASACSYQLFDPLGTLEAASARTDLDLFVLLGDTVYADGSDSIDEYRAVWLEGLGKLGYRAMRASTSLVASWDDHEVGNNWDPETIDPAKLERARQVFFEHQPLRRVEGEPGRIWRSRRWGRTAELFVLDSRSERRPSTRELDEAIYLSRAQMDWLEAGLAASDAVFKIIVNSVPIGSFPEELDLGDILLAPGDRWQGYRAAQEELLGFIEETPIPGVIVLSGDFHLACCGRAAPSGVGSATLEILAGPAKHVANPLDRYLRAPQYDWASNEMNYAALHLDPVARTVGVVYHGESGGEVLGRVTYTL
jgi:alkaline phosphatase D